MSNNSSNNNNDDNNNDDNIILNHQNLAISINKKNNQRLIGIAIHKRLNRTSNDDPISSSITLYEFLDNEQFSVLDSLLIQIGQCTVFLSEEMNDNNCKNDIRRITNLFYGRDITLKFVKKSCFIKKNVGSAIAKMVGKSTHILNVAETEKPIAYACIECLIDKLMLNDGTDDATYDLLFGSLDTVMRLDSAAADAINLLHKPDYPSQFGSIFGVLNKCKTKMGSRLLERWLRQPLIDHNEINARLDIVETLKNSMTARQQLLDGPLKGTPDIDSVLAKMQKQRPGTGLDEVFRLYVFTTKIPVFCSILSDLVADDKESQQSTTITNKFIKPLEDLIQKFVMYQQLVEHILDLDKLPDLVVNSKHDNKLEELREEQEDLYNEAERLQNATNNKVSGIDVKMEVNPQHGFIFRTTKADDERSLRGSISDIQILSIQKNGVHFTTSKLQSIGNRYKEIDFEYKHQQKDLVDKAVATAVSYLPVAEAASSIVAEIDVLCGFASAAAFAPKEYVRPTVLPKGQNIINLKGARHPCVEFMDHVEFIANEYDLSQESSFQIITGPNMGGKSTYIRGIGSIVVMAQVGSFVPCDSAEISVIDCILARVGAGDAVQKGVSTFMAEMLEASIILQTATKNSLIIIDELGRGTSTFDGFGLAWSISEYIISKINCLCLFATHFHELTALADKYSDGSITRVVNKHVTAHIENNQVVMLYSVQDGPCLQSFGIHVAASANFPKEVLDEAKRKAKELEAVGNSNKENDDDSRKIKQAKIYESMQTFKNLKGIENMTPDQVKAHLQF